MKEKRIAKGVKRYNPTRLMIRRVFVEQKDGFNAKRLFADLKTNLGLKRLEGVRVLQRYDIEGLSDEAFDAVKYTILCEAPIETLYEETFPTDCGDRVFAVEYLPGQFDQRADSAEQCIQITAKSRPSVSCARVYVLKGSELTEEDFEKVKKYLVNAVDSRIASLDKPLTLKRDAKRPDDVKILSGFTKMNSDEIGELHKKMALAMSKADLEFCREYFKNDQHRDPTITEIRVLDTYWSDHCRHTTFLTELEDVSFEDAPLNKPAMAAWRGYLDDRTTLGLDKKGKKICLMDIALIGAKALKKMGKLDDLEESEEINAASIVVEADIDGKPEQWLVMFKNETHNHPTEIEPFGGAATCLGGAIRDPLSGRSYVYQAMRVTGAADPRTPFEQTLHGKLPQRKIVTEAARGYSSYGNQIGLATGQVTEIYHAGYVAKRMEIGAVVAAAPRSMVRRGTPEPGDKILLVGGRTGRDGIGGATGSSKDHTDTALENSAEVQKGDAPMERKLQRLFRNPKASAMIKRCNDFGAGGVSVAIGELAPSLEIDLDKVPKKYDGLDGTELAISESQERMAVVVDAADAESFTKLANEENLECTHVADVTDSGSLVMKWRGKAIVDLTRKFLDTNGTTAKSRAKVQAPKAAENPLAKPRVKAGESSHEEWIENISSLNCCSQRGLVEMFDSTIGAGTVLHPYGGKTMSTPAQAMCAKLPLLNGETKTGTLFAFGFNPDISSWSPFHGAMFAVLESVAKITASGGDPERIRLTLQEYFEKLRANPERWGKPLAALLGALEAQKGLLAAAIGGKDSMSGSFNNLDVPPTLVSFAICPCDVSNVISNEFKSAGRELALFEVKLDRETFTPNFEKVRALYAKIRNAIKAGKIVSAQTVTYGGIAEAVAKMSFGNEIGMEFDPSFEGGIFNFMPGSIIAELADGVSASDLGAVKIGTTIEEPRIKCGKCAVKITDLTHAWDLPLEGVFPTQTKTKDECLKAESFEPKDICISPFKTAKPRVFIPVFPGTNCEYDSARAFENAGAMAETLVFRNASDEEVKESISEMAKRIDASQILMIPGGFSAGDEPAGSGKFIAAVFRNPELSDAVMRLLKDRKGLILGICNGFQALIKLGLVPFGEIRAQDDDSPTLYYNDIARHVSCYAFTRVASKLSPWFADSNIGDVHTVAFSHGEGKFTASPKVLEQLAKNGQIATQYVDSLGKPTMARPFNPNGSAWAIEGITSPDGLVLGKMGHSERAAKFVGKNVPGEKVQPIFASGVKYFK